MKKILSVLVFTFLFANVYSQIRVEPQSKVTSGFLYELSPQLSDMKQFDGGLDAPVVKHPVWNQMYFEISKSNLTEKQFPEIGSLHKEAAKLIRKNTIPIGLLFFGYNYLGEDAEDLLITEGVLDISEVEPGQATVFAATGFRDESFNGSEITFTFPTDFFFTNQKESIRQLFINLDDMQGWQPLNAGDEIATSYTSTGIKSISIKAVSNNYGELFSTFEMDVKKLETPPPTAIWLVEADQGYNGVSTTGDAYILLSDENSQLIKPIIVCEGIDFDDTYTWETLYELFNQQNMLDDLRAQGYDLVVLNFHTPLTYIQSNAFLFTKLVQMVNDTLDYENPISILGPSMGGMVTRYALTYMEANDVDHNCDLWISFEAPHQGANVPLGLQYGIFFFKGLDANVQMLVDILDEPAPRQMLSYHYTDPPTATAGHDALFDAFYSELDAMGNYPANLRKIALSNGRGDAIGLPYNAGDQAIEFEYYSFLVDIVGNMFAVQDNSTGLIFDGLMDYVFGADDELNVSVFSPKPYDNAPGGMRSTFAEMGALELPVGEITVLHGNHAYIPTLSALDIDEDNLFYNLSNDPNIMSLTPFDSIYWSDDNYDHTYISPELAALVIAEMGSINTDTHEILLQAGWSDLSSYIIPTEQNIENLTAQLGTNLVILQHFSEVYWPEAGANSLVNWDYKKGYLIKLNTEQTLTISGTPAIDESLDIEQGWNLIPALCSQCATIAEMLGENADKVRIIRDGVGLHVYWPEAGVYTLNQLLPGRAYYLYATEAFTLSF